MYQYKRNIASESFRIFFPILLLLWISCGQPRQAENQGNVFRMNLAAGLKTLDPAFASDKRAIWMTAQLFNGLIELDEKLQAQPAIAKKWDISPDGKTYTFHLRSDVFFHQDTAFAGLQASTRAVTAADFVYSFTRICNPQVASTGSWIFNGKIAGLEAYKAGESAHITGFEAPDDTTFIIRLTAPFPPLTGLLAMPYCFAVPKEAVDFYGEDFRAHPVGTGPFRFYRWDEGNHLIMHRNPVYWEKDQGKSLPYLDAVSVRFMPSRLSAFVEFMQGKLDFINGIDESYKDEILSPDGSIKAAYADRFQFELAPQLNIEYLGMLVDSTLAIAKGHPLTDVRVRKALNYAIDREKLVRYLLNGMGYPAHAGFVPYGMPGFDPEAVKGFSFDLKKARSLLAEAGYPNGQGLPEMTLYSTPQYANISEFIQKAFENIGVQMDVQNLQGGTLRSETRNSRINLWRASWIADYPDGENYLALLYSPNTVPNGPNTTHYANARFDSLYRAAKRITNDSARYQVYQAMDRLMLDDAPVIPLYYDRSIRILQKNVTGLVGNPMNHLQLKRVRKNERMRGFEN